MGTKRILKILRRKKPTQLAQQFMRRTLVVKKVSFATRFFPMGITIPA
jgi:hypothetical protein